MTHPSVIGRAAAKAAEWRCTQDEATELYTVADWESIRDVIANAIWLVDHLTVTGPCGTTMAREGDIEDLIGAVEQLRKVTS